MPSSSLAEIRDKGIVASLTTEMHRRLSTEEWGEKWSSPGSLVRAFVLWLMANLGLAGIIAMLLTSSEVRRVLTKDLHPIEQEAAF